MCDPRRPRPSRPGARHPWPFLQGNDPVPRRPPALRVRPRTLLDGDGPPMAPDVERRAGEVPESAGAVQPVALPGGGGDGLDYGLRLLGAKGRSARQR